VWAYDSLPHMLIAGGTGGGKTYFLLTIIQALLKSDAELFILDPKNADLADLGTIMPHVYSQKEEISECVEDFYERMIARSRS
ncbi:FtsK/SpoIIIE domain-containing protein, partial [Enterococcus faecium]